MIFLEPRLKDDDNKVLDLIRNQRTQLGSLTKSYPRRWHGSLRRNTFARAIQGSNTIEGYHATLDEAVAAVDDEPPIDEKTETWLALNGYRNAMTYIMQSAEDAYFDFSKQYLKSLHFMMTSFDLGAYPGRWRSGSVYVVNKASGNTVYDAPDVVNIDTLIEELVEYLRTDCLQSSVVTAAMAHLNLTMIHPFKDGNGRMARALQTLMLAKEGHIHPVFSSIEEWLGRNTEEYYAVLSLVGQGEWNPRNDALPWVRFCLKAHYQQASTVIRRFDEYEDLFGEIAAVIETHKLNERIALPLFDCALGLRMTNARYQRDASVTQYIAGRDLKLLADLGLVEAHGEKRGRYYLASEFIRGIRGKVRKKREVIDPYDLVKSAGNQEPKLPGF